jgi:site-specific DNA-methyltransferase (adenine-specific)
MEINKVYLGDCLDIMSGIEDKSIDMILCDLPYGTTACKWDTIIPFKPLWEQYERIIKPNGAIVLTASQPFTSALVMSNPKMFRYEWIWDKIIPTGFTMANYRPMTNHENVLVFSKGKMTYTPNGGYIKFNPQKTKRDKPIKGYAVTSKFLHDVEFDKQERIYDEKFPMSIIQFKKDKKREHTSQKPIALFEYLIKTYTNENDLVLDNCIGSGTTAIACINTKRNYIGIEKEQKYFDIATERIKAAKPIEENNQPLPQLTLFD